MSKHRQQNRAHQNNRIGTSTSVDPEIPHQFQEQIESSQSPFESGFVPRYEDIQIRAYQIHVEKGGCELENWLEAERLLKEEKQLQSR